MKNEEQIGLSGMQAPIVGFLEFKALVAFYENILTQINSLSINK